MNRLASCHRNQLPQVKEWDTEAEVRCSLKETGKWVIQEEEQCSTIPSMRNDHICEEVEKDKVLSYVVTHNFYISNLNFIPSYLCCISVLWNQHKKKVKISKYFSLSFFFFYEGNLFQLKAKESRKESLIEAKKSSILMFESVKQLYLSDGSTELAL